MADEVLQRIDGNVGILTLNRPDKLNALSLDLMLQLVERLEAFDQDDNIHVVLLAGNERAFAAGADINDMVDSTPVTQLKRNQFARWDRIRKFSKPLVAAVSGFALGGGCELAMLCDVIVASETAQFGQPEINIGVMPGAGGTQRLTRAVGKAMAMDVVLSGRFLTAQEALIHGLVARVVPREHWFTAALKLAHEIASKPPIALRLAKDAVLKAFDTTLAEGLEYERKLFYMLFSTEDQKEGMKAFLEKRKPSFRGL
jgi:enoyl-CoA hydratase